MWKDAVLELFEVVSRHLSGGATEDLKNPQDIDISAEVGTRHSRIQFGSVTL